MDTMNAESRGDAPVVTRSLPPADWSLVEKLKALRTLHGMSQAELATKAAQYLPSGLRLSRRGISGLEAGNDPEFSWPQGTYMHAVHIIAIATALGVPPTYLAPELRHDEDVRQLRGLLTSVDLTTEDQPSVTLATGEHFRWSQFLCSV